jgi:hypothetical protein
MTKFLNGQHSGIILCYISLIFNKKDAHKRNNLMKNVPAQAVSIEVNKMIEKLFVAHKSGIALRLSLIFLFENQ